jgi:hypothetical protein
MRWRERRWWLERDVWAVCGEARGREEKGMVAEREWGEGAVKGRYVEVPRRRDTAGVGQTAYRKWGMKSGREKEGSR